MIGLAENSVLVLLYFSLFVCVYPLDDISDSESKLQKKAEEVSFLRTQLFDAQQEAKEKANLVKDLQGRAVGCTACCPGYCTLFA